MGMDLLEIVLEAEEEFDIRLDHSEVPLLVSDLLEPTIAAIRKQHPERLLTDDDVWRQLRRLISDQLGVPLEQVTETANFVTDLGCE
jgi:acyl carrier protein